MFGPLACAVRAVSLPMDVTGQSLSETGCVRRGRCSAVEIRVMPRPVSLSLELLRTFLTLVHNEGDAVKSAGILGVNQPSMSKRLGYLQHSGPVLDHPWLVRVGKTWK